MEIGAIYPQSEIGNDPGFIRGFAQTVEEVGYAYLTAFDHILGADRSRFAEPLHGFGDPPYLAEHPFHEVFSLFSYLAAATTRLRFRPRVVILPQRETCLVAKQAATLDHLSGGRLELAVGVGWNHAEYAGLGADFATRGRKLDEQLEVMRRLWAEPLVTFDGEWHHLDRVGINPLPRDGGLPIWIGSGPRDVSLDRVARHGDGWIALLTPDEDLGATIARLHERLDAAGRDPSGFPIETIVPIVVGSSAEWAERIGELAQLGVTHVCLITGRDQGRSPRGHLDLLVEAGQALLESATQT